MSSIEDIMDGCATIASSIGVVGTGQFLAKGRVGTVFVSLDCPVVVLDIPARVALRLLVAPFEFVSNCQVVVALGARAGVDAILEFQPIGRTAHTGLGLSLIHI